MHSLSVSTREAVLDIYSSLEEEGRASARARAGGASAGAGAGGASGGSKVLLAASNTSESFKLAIMSNNTDSLQSFIGNPHQTYKGLNGMMLAAQHGLYESLKWSIVNGVGRSGIDKEDRMDLETSLMKACRFGIAGSDNSQRILCVQLLLLAGANPRKQNRAGDTALHLAIISGNEPVVQLFCNFPVDLKSSLFSIKNEAGLSPLDLGRDLSISAQIKKLLNTKVGDLSEPVDAPINLAALRPFFNEAVPTLEFASAIPLDCREPKVKLRHRDTSVICEVPIGEYLVSGVRRGDIGMLERFKNYIIWPDNDGRTVFMHACLIRRVDVLDWLLQNHSFADLLSVLNQADDCGCTVLHFAAAGRPPEEEENPMCMQRLLEFPVDINVKDFLGFTPLHIAAQNLHPKIVKALLSRPDCDSDVYVNGQNPLKLAVLTYESFAASSGEVRQDKQDKLEEIKLLLEPHSERVRVDKAFLDQISAFDKLISSMKAPLSQEDAQFLEMLKSRRAVLESRRDGL
jgi:ankyrin repeat protein